MRSPSSLQCVFLFGGDPGLDQSLPTPCSPTPLTKYSSMTSARVISMPYCLFLIPRAVLSEVLIIYQLIVALLIIVPGSPARGIFSECTSWDSRSEKHVPRPVSKCTVLVGIYVFCGGTFLPDVTTGPLCCIDRSRTCRRHYFIPYV